jgi:hypothetical protein
MRRRHWLWIAASLLALGGGCGQAGAAPSHTALRGDVSALRSRFNADAGKVRAIFLAAPT